MGCYLNHLQKFTELPKLYATLKDVALKCLGSIKFDADARDVFTTPRVREALNDVMDLTISALEYIAIYYSKGKISECTHITSGIACLSTVRASYFERR